MQIVVKDILARRGPPAPSEYLALQVSRLNEAMMVAYGSMAGGNLPAVDRVVRLVKEMDRYHGFFPSGDAGAAPADRLAPPAEAPLALAAPKAMEMTPQTFEKARFGDGNGERPGATTKRRRRRVAMEMAQQISEKAQFGDGNGGSHSCSRAVPGGSAAGRLGAASDRAHSEARLHLQSALVLEFEGLPKLLTRKRIAEHEDFVFNFPLDQPRRRTGSPQVKAFDGKALPRGKNPSMAHAAGRGGPASCAAARAGAAAAHAAG